MTDGLIPIAVDQSLVAVEEMAAAWIEAQDDRAELERARALLAAWRRHYERGSEEAAAARRLDLRAERRIGMLLPKPSPGRRTDREPLTTRERSHAEEQAESRARALAAVPEEMFEEEVAKPKPSRDGIIARAAGVEEERVMDALAPEVAYRRAISEIEALLLRVDQRIAALPELADPDRRHLIRGLRLLERRLTVGTRRLEVLS